MDVLRVLKALGDPTRLRMLRALSWDELSVGEVGVVLGAAQSSVSRHLSILRDAGLVDCRKDGTSVHFFLPAEMDEGVRVVFDSVSAGFPKLPGAGEDRARLDECRRRRTQRSRDYFESVAGDWESIRRSFFDDRVASMVIEKLLPGNLALADIGCGTGALTFELARLAKRVVGVDRSREMIRLARRRAKEQGADNAEFQVGDAMDLPLRRGEVDGAFCVMVLHFLDDPALAVRELCRVTRPGGTVILVDLVPHEEEWMRRDMAHRHLGFKQETALKMLRDAGARSVDCELTGAYAGRNVSRQGAGGARGVEIFVARGRLPARARKTKRKTERT